MTLKEKFLELAFEKIPSEDLSIKCEKTADDYVIEVLLSYHNSLFFLELKEGEAKEILKNIKEKKGL